MSLIQKECIEFDEERSVCIAEEKGKKYRLENNSGFKIRKIKVDKCINQKEGEKRCDYLMSIDNPNLRKAIFIELKGGALNDAVEQIYHSITYLKTEFKNFVLEARIVGSKDVPNLEATALYKKLSREVLLTKGKIQKATNNFYKEII